MDEGGNGQGGQAAPAGDGLPEGFLHLLYGVALDPSQLPRLAEMWEQHLARGGAVGGPDLAAHVARARQFLDRLPSAGREEDAQSVLSAIPRVPAFISDGMVRISACNAAAPQVLGVARGTPLAALPFEAGDVVNLSSMIRKVARRMEKPGHLRLRSTLTGAMTVLRVSPLDAAEPRPLALVVVAEPAWPDRFEVLLQDVFALTLAEVEIIRSLVQGLPVRDIAEQRGRSVETVRTQIRSIHAKTETHSQAELVRSVLGLMDLAQAPVGEPGGARSPGQLEDLPFRGLSLPDGRLLEWIEFGDPAGAPVLHLHGDFGVARWTAVAERAVRERGLRVIVPIRAGYGRSSPLPPGAELLPASVADLLALLDHFGIGRCAILALGADLRLAVALAVERPGIVAGILGCAIDLQERGRHPRERALRWPCFLHAAALRAPEMLGFLVHAAFAHVRHIGKESFLSAVLGASAAERAALRDPAVREALLVGSDVCLGPTVSAHEAFSRSLIARAEDLDDLLAACRVPVHLLQGAEDPLALPEVIADLARRHPGIEVEIVPNAGRLLYLVHWGRMIDRLGRIANF